MKKIVLILPVMALYACSASSNIEQESVPITKVESPTMTVSPEVINPKPLMVSIDKELPVLNRKYTGTLVERGSCILIEGALGATKAYILPSFDKSKVKWENRALVSAGQKIGVGEIFDFQANVGQESESYGDCGEVVMAYVSLG